MEGEFLTSSSSDSTDVYKKHKSFSEAIYDQFPYYLSIGMTEAQYFDGDNELVKYYRKADELRKKRTNSEAWLQGMYVYDAISRLAPVLRAFAKKGTKPEPYVDEPYPIDEAEAEEKKEKVEKAKTNKGLMYMRSVMISNNKKFEGSDSNANNH